MHRVLRALMLGFSIALLTVVSATAAPTTLQGPADAGRFRPEERVAPLAPRDDAPVVEEETPLTPQIPSGLDSSPFTLKTVNIEGATAFSDSQLADIYAPYLGQQVTLDIAYRIAGRITERYRASGYFLSLASVTDRDAKAGIVRIKITEGYIGEVELRDAMADNHVVQAYIDQVKLEKPISSKALESFLLRLNDLPGLSFRAVLARANMVDEAAVKLVLIPTQKQGRGTITVDNYGSRFLGPNEAILSYSTSLYPLAQTNVSVITSLPVDELNSGSIEHSVVVAPDIIVGVNASYTDAHPGYNLEVFEINSDSTSLGFYAKYQWIRQRQENLALKLAFEGRHSTTELLGIPFTRDDIRVLRASANYDKSDNWRGNSMLNIIISQGIDGLGASRQGDINLSRAEAKPDFTKAEFNVSRLQGFGDSWSALVSVSGQAANGALYSAEEFGYGGQGFGRAYDSSELTGDHGVSGSVEVRYGGFDNIGQINLSPYVFYDAGAVWNVDRGQLSEESASAAGAGIRFSTRWDMTGNLSLAWPLTRQIVTPVYGASENGPRIMLQLSQGF